MCKAKRTVRRPFRGTIVVRSIRGTGRNHQNTKDPPCRPLRKEDVVTKQVCITVSLGSFCTSSRYIRRKFPPLSARLIITSRREASGAVYLTVSPSLGTCNLPKHTHLFRIGTGLGRVGTIHHTTTPNNILAKGSCSTGTLTTGPGLTTSIFVTGPHVSRCLTVDTGVCNVCLGCISTRSVRICSISRIFVSIANCLHTCKGKIRRVAHSVVHSVRARANVATATNVNAGVCLTGITVSVITGRVRTKRSNVHVTQLSRVSCQELL